MSSRRATCRAAPAVPAEQQEPNRRGGLLGRLPGRRAQGDPHDVVAGLAEEGRGDGAVDAPAEPHDNGRHWLTRSLT